MKTLEVWHFTNGKLRDGRPLPQPGVKLVHDGPVIPCRSGYHGSVRALDALRYAAGATVSRCVLSGTIVPHENDKHAASERTVLWYADAIRTLHEFACWCAEEALTREREAGREPAARSWRAIEVKRAWLDGKATDAELDAAWDAARAAAWDAARAAARDAARAAARDAAEAAAWAATGAAARAAAWDAAWAAAWDAASDAAMDAAGAAARAAAWGRQNEELERRLMALEPVRLDAATEAP